MADKRRSFGDPSGHVNHTNVGPSSSGLAGLDSKPLPILPGTVPPSSEDLLHDRCLRLLEENRRLKEERNSQDEKIKQMATKFARIMQDIKKEGKGDLVPTREDGVPMIHKTGGTGRDMDTEAFIANLQRQLRVSQRQADELKSDRAALLKRLERAQKATMRHPSAFRPGMANVGGAKLRTGSPPPGGLAVVPPLRKPVSPATYIEGHKRAALRDRPTQDSFTQTQAPHLVTSFCQTPSFELFLRHLMPTPAPTATVAVGSDSARRASVPAAADFASSSSSSESSSTGTPEAPIVMDQNTNLDAVPTHTDPVAQRAYIHRLHELIRAMKAKMEEQQQVMERTKQEHLALLKERDGLVRTQESLQNNLAVQEEEQSTDIATLQRRIMEKNSKLVLLHNRFLSLEAQLMAFKETNITILAEMKQLNDQLSEARRKNLELERDVQLATLAHDKNNDYQTMLNDLRAEKRTVEQENAHLVQQMMEQRTSVEMELRREYADQIKDLEAAIFKWESTSKKQFKDHQAVEERCRQLTEETKTLRAAKERADLKCARMEADVEILTERCRVLLEQSRKGDQPDAILDKLLALTRLPSERHEAPIPTGPPDLVREIERLRLENASLLRELAALRATFDIQKRELDDYSRRSSDHDSHSRVELTRLQELMRETREQDAKIIQTQLQRIIELEQLLGNVEPKPQAAPALATGVRVSTDEPLSAIAGLTDQENLIEVHLGHLRLDYNPASVSLADDLRSVFLSLDFLEHVTQLTDVMTISMSSMMLGGQGHLVDRTFLYSCPVNDFLQFYLETRTLDIDLNEAHGHIHSIMGSVNISLRPLLDGQELVQGFATLLSRDRKRVGQLEFSLRVHRSLPRIWIDQFRQRARQTGQPLEQRLDADGAVVPSPATLRDTESEAIFWRLRSVSSITIHVVQCAGLRVSPATGANIYDAARCLPYVFYAFYDTDRTVELPAHYLSLAPPGGGPPASITSPVFNDIVEFPCPLHSARFLNYLAHGTESEKTTGLGPQIAFIVYNDCDENPDHFIGIAKVSLRPMLQGSNARIHGTFPLTDPEGLPSGTIDVRLQWNTSERVQQALSLNAELAMQQLQQ